MLAMKSRTGRHRRDGVPRDEHGRIDRAHYQEDPRTLPAWNRYRDVAKDMGLDPRMATQRGRLFYASIITSAEFEAANRWADMLEAYDMLILGRRRTPAPPALERLGMGESTEHDPQAIEEFKDRFQKLHRVLMDAGKVAEIALTRICRDEGAGAYANEAIRGMRALAVHLGLTKQKSGRKREIEAGKSNGF
jgi:hypothetical protein